MPDVTTTLAIANQKGGVAKTTTVASEAPAVGRSILATSPTHRGAQAYREMASAMVARRNGG
jgi:cellulose biosynthesis protein BcsQ